MKLFGHPLHPVFVHFPTALLPMDLALSLIDSSRHDPSLLLAGFYCAAAGVLTGWLALATGLADLFSIPRQDTKAVAAGLYHGFLNGTIILAFTLLTLQGWRDYPVLTPPGWKQITLKSLLILLLFIGNYIGGKLIYKHHIGLNPKPDHHGSIETQN